MPWKSVAAPNPSSPLWLLNTYALCDGACSKIVSVNLNIVIENILFIAEYIFRDFFRPTDSVFISNIFFLDPVLNKWNFAHFGDADFWHIASYIYDVEVSGKMPITFFHKLIKETDNNRGKVYVHVFTNQHKYYLDPISAPRWHAFGWRDYFPSITIWTSLW